MAPRADLRAIRRRRPIGLPLAAVALVALGLGLLLPATGFVAPPGTARAPARERNDTVRGAVALGDAAAALASGAGPARGVPAQCGVTASGLTQCLVPARPADAANGTVWTNLSGIESNEPGARILGSMVWDGYDGYVLLFGGCTVGGCSGTMDGDTWIFTHGQWVELSPNVSPPPRAIAQAAYDPADHEVVVFGGLPSSGTTALDDTWTFAGGQWTDQTSNLTTSPTGRYRGAMTYDASDGYVVLFGGTNSSASTSPYNQTWEWHGQQWTDLSNEATGHPVGRYRLSMAYDPVDGYVVLFGGSRSSTVTITRDTWTYHNLTWTNISNYSNAPSARVYYGLTWDPALGMLVLIDGAQSGTGPSVGGTWGFVKGNWTNLTTAYKLTVAPSDRGFEMVAFDAADNGTLLFGGSAESPSTYTNPLSMDDTWFFGPPVFATASVAPTTVDLHQSSRVSVLAASDATPLSYAYAPLPAGCSSSDASSIDCAPSAPGNYTIGIEVTDATGNSTNLSANLSVIADPAITSFGVSPTVVTQGTSVTFSIAGTSGERPYRYSFLNLPPGCTSRGNANLTCAPGTAGNYTVEGEITDAASYSVYANTSLTVHPLPSVASFSATPSVIDLGQSTRLAVRVAGGTAPYSYDYPVLPPGCTSSDVASVTCSPTHGGGYLLTVNVTDAFGWSANGTVGLTVNRHLSTASYAISEAVVDAGIPFSVWLNATGGTAPYTFVYSGGPSGCGSVNASEWSCTTEVPGNYTIVANATDAVGESVVAEYNVTVDPKPSIVTFSATPSPVDELTPTKLSVAAAGGTAPLSYDYLDLPYGCVSADSASLSCTARIAGPYSLEVVVTDSFGLSASATLDLDIHPDPSIGAIAATPNPVSVGDPTTINVTAGGGVGALTYVYAGLPAGCTSANSPTLTCTPTAAGLSTVEVTVNDSLGRNATAEVQLSVNPRSSGGGGGSSGATGGLSDETLALIGGVVLLAAALGAAAVVALRRRRAPPPPEAPAAPPEWSEDPPNP